MKQTPFDEIALHRYDYDTNLDLYKLSLITNLATELRVRLNELLDCVTITNEMNTRILSEGNQGNHSMTKGKMLTQQFESLKPVLAYQDFIGTLNIHGRVLNNIGILIPNYYRIRFYRNKIVEHWDDYLGKSCIVKSGYTFILGKIAIPFHSGKANFPADAKLLWISILNEFKRYGIHIDQSWEDNLNYESYTIKIWQYLEEIDRELNTSNKNKIIQENLVELLYDYAMPVPFLNVEEYCEKLANTLNQELRKIIEGD